MSSYIVEETWTRLETSRPRGDNLTARLAFPDSTPRLLAAIDAAGTRHLLVVLESKDEAYRDLQSRGISVDTRDLRVEGRTAERYLDLVCHDASGYAAFDLIGGELAETLKRGGLPPREVVRQVLSKWRRFWGQTARQVLTREEQVGLFGELWFLLKWLSIKVGPDEATRRWRGPSGARHDFEWVGGSIEVKSTTATVGRVHHINGVEQLAPPETGILMLYSIVLREEAGAEYNLPSLIASCRDQLHASDEGLALFDDSIAKTGYSPAHEEEYAKLHLHVIKDGIFRVEGRFPRLTPQLFPSGVPDGVVEIDYTIDLAGFDDLCLFKSPREFNLV